MKLQFENIKLDANSDFYKQINQFQLDNDCEKYKFINNHTKAPNVE